MKHIFTLIMIAVLLLFPQKAYCAGDSDAKQYFYSRILFDETEAVYFESFEVFPDKEGTEDCAAYILNELFSVKNQMAYNFPKGTEVLSSKYDDGHILIDISGEIAGYGGGSYIERALISQIVKTLLDMPEIEEVSLTVNGDIYGFPEGTIISRLSSYEALTEGIIS